MPKKDGMTQVRLDEIFKNRATNTNYSNVTSEAQTYIPTAEQSTQYEKCDLAHTPEAEFIKTKKRIAMGINAHIATLKNVLNKHLKEKWDVLSFSLDLIDRCSFGLKDLQDHFKIYLEYKIVHEVCKHNRPPSPLPPPQPILVDTSATMIQDIISPHEKTMSSNDEAWRAAVTVEPPIIPDMVRPQSTVSNKKTNKNTTDTDD